MLERQMTTLHKDLESVEYGSMGIFIIKGFKFQIEPRRTNQAIKSYTVTVQTPYMIEKHRVLEPNLWGLIEDIVSVP